MMRKLHVTNVAVPTQLALSTGATSLPALFHAAEDM
jgi:hypothetical protein